MYTDGGFASHQCSGPPIQAVKVWTEYKNRSSEMSIVNLISDEKQKQIAANRHYVSCVIDVLRYTAVHRIAQRGHDETPDAVNPGNFLGLMHLLGKYDPIISQKFTDLPGNAKYTSKIVQNDILCTMADMVRKGITSEVQECGEFTVMIDESKDCRKIEQMSLVLRYFWNGCV